MGVATLVFKFGTLTSDFSNVNYLSGIIIVVVVVVVNYKL